jgi:hypothetical protein
LSINYNPNNQYPYANRGDLKLILNDLAGACSDWKKASELGHIKSFEKYKENCGI